MRGTDKLNAIAGRIIQPSEYSALISQYLDRHPDALIYLATDSPVFLQQMKADRISSDRLVHYNALRTRRNAFADPNVTDHYKKGEDALVESLLLSCSNFLVKPASALSEFAVYFNPDLHGNTAELQYTSGALPPVQVLNAHFMSRRDGLRGMDRCARVLR